MNYRIVCRGEAGDFHGVTPWFDSPKGLQLQVIAWNASADCPGRYWLEEGPRAPALPVTGLAAISDTRTLKGVQP